MKIPKEAQAVFEGKILTIYQWQQKLYDRSLATFEMAKSSFASISYYF